MRWTKKGWLDDEIVETYVSYSGYTQSLPYIERIKSRKVNLHELQPSWSMTMTLNYIYHPSFLLQVYYNLWFVYAEFWMLFIS